ISASLKASFFGGLVSVGGSATYINDTKSSSHNARVTLKYSRTTRFDQLTMNHLGAQNMTYPEVFDKGTATHVVTGILYGAQAFLIFDREQEKESVSRFNCTFHGDFALDKNPVTYEEAINTYANLPKLLGPDGEKAVPAKVWLYSLTENILQEMTDVNMQCNDLMRHPAAEIFPDIKKKMRQFREYCEQFTLVFQKQLAQTLPSIRGGGMEEVALVNILAGKDRSPFAKLHVAGYLSTKRQEMDTVSSYLKVLEHIQVLPSEHELNQVVTDPMVDFIVCYNFTSLNEGETYLSDLTDWLPILEHLENEVYKPNTVTPWFKNTDLIKKARVYVRAFQEFTQANASREDTHTPGFGDTQGIEQDRKVTEAIHAFFAGDRAIDQIDAVCFVVQAALARLTPTQKYIFSSVFYFGKRYQRQYIESYHLL
uniref:SNTX thioredoxin-like domain-containing protein n=1 Tax=Leptobrachium leishanense TaxID=445787 RepID=A0A8C5MHJ3_9ANUR